MFSLTIRYWFFVNPQWEIGTYVDDYQAFALQVMLGYLLYDTAFELKAGKQVMTLGHHVLGAASHISVLYSNNGGVGFYRSVGICIPLFREALLIATAIFSGISARSMMVFIAEGSTPLLNISWLLQKLNMLKTKIFKSCAITLIVSFFFLRIVLSPIMLHGMLKTRHQWAEHSDVLFWFNFIIVGLFGALNYYWFYKLVEISLRKK
jgi:hypothetical protein